LPETCGAFKKVYIEPDKGSFELAVKYYISCSKPRILEKTQAEKFPG
jgi:hypothetical protein